MDNPIKQLQENLARDLVKFEELVSEQVLDKLTETYSQVYDIISKINDKSKK